MIALTKMVITSQQNGKILDQIIDKRKAVSQTDLIAALNPIIKGWSNYFSSVCSKKIFNRLDDLVYKKISHWAKRRHPNKSWQWITRKYWRTIGNDRWCFATNNSSDNSLKLLFEKFFLVGNLLLLRQ